MTTVGEPRDAPGPDEDGSACAESSAHTQVIDKLVGLGHKHGIAKSDMLDIMMLLKEMRGAAASRPEPQPIHTAPQDRGRTLLLYCPDQGGWHSGEWFGSGTAGFPA
jgi:hypothetical protein